MFSVLNEARSGHSWALLPTFKQLWKGEGLSWRLQFLIFLVGVIIVVSRRPDALFNAQFWAEDGDTWFAQAYNLGRLPTLVRPEGGYLNTLPRLVATVTLFFPLRFAPLLMNCVGIALQVLPITVLLSSRCSSWGSLRVRMLYAALYLALPNSWEINVNITDAHFHLALVAFLLATGVPPTNWKWKGFDVAVLFLSGLTGPWSLVLLPLVLVFWWVRRYRWSLVVAGITALCAATQALALLAYTGAGARPPAHLGADLWLLLRILGGHVFAGALVGQNSYGTEGSIGILATIALLGVGTLIYTFFESRLELKLFLVFCSALLTASLSRPIIVTPLAQWQALLTVMGARYWFFPMLAFVWSLVWCASESQTRFIRQLCTAALLTMTVGIVSDWRYEPYEDKKFREYSEKFSMTPSKALIEIPINPNGRVVRLTKK